MPHVQSFGPPATGAPLRSTLQLSAGAMATMPPARKRGVGLWLGLAALVAAGAAVAVVIVVRDRAIGPVQAPGGAGDAGVVAVVTPDAAVVAVVVPDAARVPVDAPDPIKPVPEVVAEPEPEPASDAAVAAIREPRSSGNLEAAARLSKSADAKLANGASDLQVLKDALAIYGSALHRYEAAYESDRDPAALYGIAYTAYRLGLFSKARSSVQTLVATLPDPPLDEQARQLQRQIDDAMAAQGIAPSSGEAAPSGRAASKDPSPASRELAPPVRAASKEPSPADEAARLTAEANKLMYADQFKAALPLYQRAYDLAPGAQALVRVCIAEINNGYCKEAYRDCPRIKATWPEARNAQKAQDAFDRFVPVCERARR
jgi:tetratricopeptide (TPR) repeat protein